MAWRRPSRRVYRSRIEYYKRFVSDDVAEFMSWRLPMTSPAARRSMRIMRDMVEEFYRQGVRDDPRYTRQDAIDDATTDVLTKIEQGEDVDWALRYLASP